MKKKARTIEPEQEYETPFAKLPEFKLVRAIVFRAIQDAIGGPGTKRAREKLSRKHISDARRWLNSTSDEFFSFVWCSQVICTDWATFVHEVRRFINAEEIDTATLKRIEQIRRQDVHTTSRTKPSRRGPRKTKHRATKKLERRLGDERQSTLYENTADSKWLH